MKLKIPPAVITLFCGFFMWAVEHYLGPFLLNFPGHHWFAFFFVLISLILGVLGLIQFYRNQTSIDPHKPDKASTLVQGGIYKISRNPMYVSLLLLLVALGWYLGNLFTFIILPFFIWYMNRFQIIPEEEILLKRFGRDYKEYKLQVRRWI